MSRYYKDEKNCKYKEITLVFYLICYSKIILRINETKKILISSGGLSHVTKWYATTV